MQSQRFCSLYHPTPGTPAALPVVAVHVQTRVTPLGSASNTISINKTYSILSMFMFYILVTVYF